MFMMTVPRQQKDTRIQIPNEMGARYRAIGGFCRYAAMNQTEFWLDDETKWKDHQSLFVCLCMALLVGQHQRWEDERGGDTQDRTPGRDSNPGLLHPGQSLCMWDARSTIWADEHPRIIKSYYDFHGKISKNFDSNLAPEKRFKGLKSQGDSLNLNVAQN